MHCPNPGRGGCSGNSYAVGVCEGSKEIRCLTNSSGAERNGEWLVSIETTFSHSSSVYLRLCIAGPMDRFCKHSMYLRLTRPKYASLTQEPRRLLFVSLAMF